MNERLHFKLGAIGGLLGVNGGAGGTGFGGPTANPADPTGMNNLQATYQQLGQIANGQGPNPAMAQYNQNVQNIAKQQAGAISSVQGISPALAARLATQQGSAAMQNAAGQGATLQAQQQLGALGQMGSVANSQAQIAAGLQQNVNTNNTGLAQTTMGGQQGVIGGIFGGLGAAAGGPGAAAAAAEGGMAGKDFAAGGEANGADAFNFGQPTGQSSLSRYLSGMGDAMASPNAQSGPGAIQKGMTQFGAGLGKAFRSNGTPQNDGSGPTVQNASAIGGGIPYTQPMGLGFGAAPAYAKGGISKDFRGGGKVKASTPAQKAVKPGNSYANDKIPAVLSEGEVVIPRDVMQAPDPVRASADFVANVIAKRRAGR